jgi:hypothetical protein
MKLTDSRGPTVDTQKCVEQVGGNRFDLVLIATVRARELSRRHKAAGHTTQVQCSGECSIRRPRRQDRSRVS